MKRKYISIYLPLIDDDGARHTKNVCIAFNEEEKILFQKLKKINSQDIKKAIAIFSYKQLIDRSKKENRKPAELIKLLLTEKLIHKGQYIKRSVKFNPAKLKKWISILKGNKIDGEIADFLASIVYDA